MDAFFSAIEQRDNPKFRNRPVIVGADPKRGKGRGVVSTASYEARKFGVRSAMSIAEAYRRCPQGVYLRPQMDKYSQASEEIYDIFYQFTPLVEPVGIDEAFLDISGSFHIFGTPEETCFKLKEKIKKEIKLTASVGLAPVKIAAKIASDLNKPDGFCQVKNDKLLDFLWPLDIVKLPGVGKKTKKIFNDLGINNIGQLANFNQNILQKYLGRNGIYFWQLANGIDQREVEVPEEAKSVGNEITFSQDTTDKILIEAVLSGLAEKVSARLREKEIKAKSICLKVRLADFSTQTRSMQLTAATNFYNTIFKALKSLYASSNFKGRKIRLLGAKAAGLVDSSFRDSIFDEFCQEQKIKTDKIVDRLKEKFGKKCIQRGMSLYKRV